MSRQKRLNILNTDRHFNINLMRASDIEKKVKVNRLNEATIEKEMDELARKSKRYPLRNKTEYIIYQEKYTNDNLIQKVIKHGGGITYYTSTIIPYYVLTQLAMNLNSEVVYSIRKNFTDREQENIELSYMATRVIIDVPVVIPDISPYELLFSLEKLKTDVDKIQLSFPPLRPEEISERHKEYYEQVGDLFYVKAQYKYEYFQYIQTSLSLWKMNIWIVTTTEEEYEAMDKIIQKAVKKRSTKTKVKPDSEAVELNV